MRVGEPTSAIRYASPMFPMSTNVFSNVLLRLFFVVTYFKCFPMLSYGFPCFLLFSYLFSFTLLRGPQIAPKADLEAEHGRN